MSEHQPPETSEASESSGESEASETSDAAETADESGASESERSLIRQGREFEREYALDATAAGEFLVAVGEQLQSGEAVTLQTDEWELPFGFGEPIGLEIDYEGVGHPTLEVELEIPGAGTDDAPDVR